MKNSIKFVNFYTLILSDNYIFKVKFVFINDCKNSKKFSYIFVPQK